MSESPSARRDLQPSKEAIADLCDWWARWLEDHDDEPGATWYVYLADDEPTTADRHASTS